MRVSLITGCLMSACIFAAALPLSRPASAADLDGDGYAEPPYDDSAYGDGGYDDDERYDRYGEAPPPDRYRDSYNGREQLPGSIKDGYPVPMPPPQASAPPPPPRYAERPPVRVDRYACLDRWQIRHRLRREGWTGIRPMGGDGEIVHIRANRFDSSSMFHLRVDRCSGAVLTARPQVRHFAYRDWRWERRDW
jgi:hypothetical protein